MNVAVASVEGAGAAATTTVKVVVIVVVASSAVTTTVTVLLPVTRPVSPVITAFALASVGVATTVTDVTPLSTLMVSPSTWAVPLTVNVAVASVEAALAVVTPVKARDALNAAINNSLNA